MVVGKEKKGEDREIISKMGKTIIIIKVGRGI